ncbi:hypothetical protein PRIPAC_83625, partial [Pristionchus pacificus]|uniref:Uncharacterized protein n=1 Tax=Pristionchus pacificus TaxID=54126 RepID=A0A2A6BU88_PRIPA
MSELKRYRPKRARSLGESPISMVLAPARSCMIRPEVTMCEIPSSIRISLMEKMSEFKRYRPKRARSLGESPISMVLAPARSCMIRPEVKMCEIPSSIRISLMEKMSEFKRYRPKRARSLGESPISMVLAPARSCMIRPEVKMCEIPSSIRISLME